MIGFIKVNMYSIIVVLVFIMGLLFVCKNGKKNFVKEVILSLIVQAEMSIGSGTGELKYAMVVEGIYGERR